MVGEIIAAIVIGIIAGYLGRLLLPGRDPMGFVQTVIFGIIGALVGYFLFTSVLGIGDDDKFDLGGSSAPSSARCSCCWSGVLSRAGASPTPPPAARSRAPRLSAGSMERTSAP
jgi:uncharacterized membrane protein YeaQ/YmgE (transglycosylase-associated protein family)